MQETSPSVASQLYNQYSPFLAKKNGLDNSQHGRRMTGMRRGWDARTLWQDFLSFMRLSKPLRHPAHTTNAANEQQSRSPFGLMIGLLLVLLLQLFHARWL